MEEAPMTNARCVALLTLLAACSTPPQLTGRVVDIWGSPIEGAMVKMDGFSNRPVTDAHGRFQLPLADGVHTIKAGREGYIQEDAQVEVASGAVRAAGGGSEVILSLYPIPVEKGFHVVGADRYHKLQPKLIRAVGNNIESLYGIREPGTTSVDGDALRFVYHGDLRHDQLMALDVSLHRLSFVERAELVSVTATDVKLDLYVADKRVPLQITRLKSRNNYLLEAAEPLDHPRVYALTTNRLLDPPDDEAFQRIAPALRLAFPVELR
jgi:hypothetical protein